MRFGWCSTLSVAAAICLLGADANAQPAPPLVVNAPTTHTPGTGRAVIPVRVTGGPGPALGELAKVPELVGIQCRGATTIPATQTAPALVVAPAVTRSRSLACTARSRGVETAFQLGIRSPGPGVYGSVSPAQPKAGETLRLRVFSLADITAPIAPTALRVVASAGQVTMQGGGRVSIKLPSGAAPRVVSLVFSTASGYGAVFVPVLGSTVLPIDTALRASVRVRVGGRWFGPVQAARKRVRVPLQVPPGIRQAVARATDRLGNAKETLADLGTPDAPRIAVVADADQVNGGKTITLAVALAHGRGEPAGASSAIVGSARLGAVGAAKFKSPGLWLVEYTAPRAGGDDEITFRVGNDAGAGIAKLRLRVKPAKKKLPPPPPVPRLVHLDVYGAGGWATNGADVSAPRAGVGVGVSRLVGPVELAFASGLEVSGFSDQDSFTFDGQERDVDRSVRSLGVPLRLRARLPLFGHIGATVAGVLVPTRVSVTLTPSFQDPDRYSQLVWGRRAELGLDWKLKRNRVSVFAGLGTAKLSSGPLMGELEGISVIVNYSRRFAAFGAR